MLLKCISMSVLCLYDTMALSLHISIAAAEGEIKEASFWAAGIILLECTDASLIGPCETAEKWWQSWKYFLVNCRISSLSLSIKVPFVIHPTHVVMLTTRGGKLPHSYLTANPCCKEPHQLFTHNWSPYHKRCTLTHHALKDLHLIWLKGLKRWRTEYPKRIEGCTVKDCLQEWFSQVLAECTTVNIRMMSGVFLYFEYFLNILRHESQLKQCKFCMQSILHIAGGMKQDPKLAIFLS